MTDTDMKKAREITGDCSCHEGFKSRNLIDLQCHYHDMTEEITAALRAEYERGQRDMLLRAAAECDRISHKQSKAFGSGISYGAEDCKSAIAALPITTDEKEGGE